MLRYINVVSSKINIINRGFSNASCIAQRTAPLSGQMARRMGTHGGEHGHQKSLHELAKEHRVTINDLPVPSGSWQQNFNSRNTKWNMYLIGNIVLFGVTLAAMKKYGVFLLHEEPDFKKINVDMNSPLAGQLELASAEVTQATEAPEAPVALKETEAPAPVAQKSSSDEAPPKSEATPPPPPAPITPTFPTEVPYVIVGAGTAAFAAYRAIRSKDSEAQVLLIGDEDERPYMRPPLSKELWFSEDKEAAESLRFKQWNGKERSIYFEKEQFFCKPEELADKDHGGVAVLKNTRVTDVNISKQYVRLDNGKTVKYKKLLLATGGRPRNLPVIEKAGDDVAKNITLFRRITDFKKLNEVTQSAKTIAIVGGGFLGSELACALGKRGKETGMTVIQTYPEAGSIGKVLPEYLSKWTLEKIKNEGVDVKPGTFVTGCSFNKETNQVKLVLNNGEEILADHVVVATGLEPNVDLSKTSRLETSEKYGGFLVNAELEARSNVWVAGDAACFYDVRLGRRRVEHHDHAVVSGRLAGENMTGAGKHYSHQSMFWSDLGPEIGFEAIGIVDSDLPTVGVFAKATEKDTPKAVVEQTGESLRSETEKNTSEDVKVSKAPVPVVAEEDFGKGVIFYTKDKIVVGLLMWNVFNKMGVARKIIRTGITEDEIPEAAKLFELHGESQQE